MSKIPETMLEFLTLLDIQLFVKTLLSCPEIEDMPHYLLATQNRKAMVPCHYLKLNLLWSTKHLLKILNYLLSKDNLIRVPENEQNLAILMIVGSIFWPIFSFAFDNLVNFVPIWLLMLYWSILDSVDKTVEEASMVVKLPLRDWRHVDSLLSSENGICW